MPRIIARCSECDELVRQPEEDWTYCNLDALYGECDAMLCSYKCGDSHVRDSHRRFDVEPQTEWYQERWRIKDRGQ